MDLKQKLDLLIEQWCERRALRPLRYLLPNFLGPLVHTDQVADLLEALRDVKGLCRTELKEDELKLVIEAINEVEDWLAARLAGPTDSKKTDNRT